MTDRGKIDRKTVDGLGEERVAFDQTDLPRDEQRRTLDDYLSVFLFAGLPADVKRLDLGCGSGRWADLMATRVGHLHCIDLSDKALGVARRRLGASGNMTFHHVGVDSILLAYCSQNFGYSPGVLHHIPSIRGALHDCAVKLKPGRSLLGSLYYSFSKAPNRFRTGFKQRFSHAQTKAIMAACWLTDFVFCGRAPYGPARTQGMIPASPVEA